MRIPALAALLGACLAAPSQASDQLDPDFGSGGQVLLPFDLGETGFETARDVLALPGGGLLLGGTAEKGSGPDTNRDFALARLRPDGSLDPAFGSGGRRTIAFDLGGFSDEIESLAHYPGGRVVAAGTAENAAGLGGFGAIAVARLFLDGTLDTSFSLSGRTSFLPQVEGVPTPASVAQVAVQGDGRILLGGTLALGGTLPTAFVARLLANGGLDSGFGQGGIVLLAPGTADPAVALGGALALRPDGRILLAGTGLPGPAADNLDMFLAQLLPDGSPDPDFGDAGSVFIGFDQGGDNRDIARALALDALGRATLAGAADTAAFGRDIALARLQPDGSPDPSFGTDGRVLVGFDRGGGFNDEANALVIGEDGRITVVGFAEVAPSNEDVAILRLLPNGQPDGSFGSGGQLTIGIDNAPPAFVAESGSAAVFDPQGRLVVVGGAYLGPQALNFDMLALRFESERLFRDGFESPP